MIARLRDLGLATVVIDWRGQGLSDRPIPGRSVGHVGDFAEYQDDLATVLAHPAVNDLPDRRVLFAHSMGGCIALRALVDGIDARAAVFSAPMWGINMSPLVRSFATVLIWAGQRARRTRMYLPGTGETSYVATQPFEGNLLTHEPAQYARLAGHLVAHPELGLGGPSLGWLAAANAEMKALAALPPPQLPILTFVGTDEAIVSTEAIRRESARQPGAELVVCDRARHEIFMESARVQTDVWARVAGFLAAHVDGQVRDNSVSA